MPRVEIGALHIFDREAEKNRSLLAKLFHRDGNEKFVARLTRRKVLAVERGQDRAPWRRPKSTIPMGRGTALQVICAWLCAGLAATLDF